MAQFFGDLTIDTFAWLHSQGHMNAQVPFFQASGLRPQPQLLFGLAGVPWRGQDYLSTYLVKLVSTASTYHLASRNVYQSTRLDVVPIC